MLPPGSIRDVSGSSSNTTMTIVRGGATACGVAFPPARASARRDGAGSSVAKLAAASRAARATTPSTIRKALRVSTKRQGIRGFYNSATMQARLPKRETAVDDVRGLSHTRPMRRGIWVALAVGLALFAASPASAGTVRHASPDGAGSGSDCTAGEPPCSLKRAVETVAAAGDEVVLAPGTYNPPSTVAITKAISVHGASGQERARVLRPTGLVFTVGGGGTLADVQAESAGSVISGSATIERVVALAEAATGSPSAVTITGGGVLRDSLVRTEATNGRAVTAQSGVVDVVNVTAIATGTGSSGLRTDSTTGGICVPASQIELHATNVIARGGRYDVSVPHLCGASGGPFVEVAYLAHSNFRRAKLDQSPPNSRVEDAGGNQEADPLFAAPASLDFHELAASATIDAGVDTPQLGAGDLDGEPRTQGGAPDIGADEFVPPAPPGDTHRPVASLLTVAPGTFRATAARTRRRRGARISYALDEQATVTFTVKRIITRVVRGRKRTRYRPVRGSFIDAGELGGNRIRFSGRMSGRRLKPGRYRLIALPVDAARNTGNAALARFRVVR